MKKVLLVFFLMVAIVGFNEFAFASIESQQQRNFKIEQECRDVEEYKNIFADFLMNSDKILVFQERCRAAIKKYKEFIQKYPQSDFAPEAKLRIAEFWDIVREQRKAKKWLNDIINNHSQDNYFKIKVHRTATGNYLRLELADSGEKTAAWALLYRALWFAKGLKGLEENLVRIINEYPESKEVIKEAKELLDGIIEKERREK